MPRSKPFLAGVRLGTWAKLFSSRPDIFLIHNTGGGGVINAVTGEYVVNQDYTKANGPFGEEINTNDSLNTIDLQISNENGFTCITFARYKTAGQDHRLFGYPGQTPSAWADTLGSALRSTSFSGTTVNGPAAEIDVTLAGYRGEVGYHCWGVAMASGDPTSGNFVNGVKSATGNPGTWTTSNLLSLYSDGGSKSSDALYIWTIAFNEKLPDAEIEYITANPEEIYSILDLDYETVKAPSGIVLPFDLGSKLGFGLVKQKKNFTAQTLVSPPIISAGADVNGPVNTPIQLNGTVTPGSSAVTILWTFTGAGSGAYSDDTIANPTFTPDTGGDNVTTHTLTVSSADWIDITDEALLTANDVVVIPPAISAGDLYTGDAGAPGAVLGVLTPGSDPSPVILWDVVSGGTGVFAPTDNVSSNFTPTIGVESRITIRITATPNDGPPVSSTTTYTTTNFVPDDTESGIVNNIVTNISTNIVRGVT